MIQYLNKFIFLLYLYFLNLYFNHLYYKFGKSKYFINIKLNLIYYIPVLFLNFKSII